MTLLRAGSATDIGRVRTTNQDQLLVTDELFAVADGMGGHAAGEVASLTAVEALRATYQDAGGTEGLVAATREANRSIFERARGNPELHGMGTTLVAVALVNEGDEDRLAIVNVGDSRVYLLRQGELEQLTTDHSLVQELVDDGQLTEAEATVHPQRHVLTRALGVDVEVNVDLLQVLPLKGDRLLLCSDGLVRELSDVQVASILRRLADPEAAARELVAAAKNRGGNDNITVVIVDVVDDDELAQTASEALKSDRGAYRPTPLPTFEIEGGDIAAGPETLARGRSGPLDEPAPPVVDKAPKVPQRRAITVRVVGFVALLVVLVGGAGFAVAWYARGTYFVGLDNGVLTIYQGRPGGLAWFQPTVVERTKVTEGDVLRSRLSDLQSGMEEPSLSQARAYVARLQSEKAEQVRAAAATTPASTPINPTDTTSTAPTGAPSASTATPSTSTTLPRP